MYYLNGLKPYEYKQIHRVNLEKGKPVAIRFDINSPVDKTGRISQNGEVNLRLEKNGYLIKAYSKLAPLLLMAHQGRKNPPGEKRDKNYVNLLDHHNILSNISRIRIHFVEWVENASWEEYSKTVEKHLKTLRKGEAVLMDNMRIWVGRKNLTQTPVH